MNTSSEGNVTRIELLLRNELKDLFYSGFSEDCLDQLGYDLRLGDEVFFVTRGGESINLEKGGEIEIFPGETVIVRTEEVLNLRDDVYAVGSPKMSLLVDGLWAHGGKTDPGYNSKLTLGFQNVGSKPCKIKREQKIFHLTFYRIHGKKAERYAGGGPGFPSVAKSPLEGEIEISEKLLEKVKEADGIKSYRLYRQICSLKNEIGRSFRKLYYFPFIGLMIIIVISSLEHAQWIKRELGPWLTILASIIAIVGPLVPWSKIRKTIWGS